MTGMEACEHVRATGSWNNNAGTVKNKTIVHRKMLTDAPVLSNVLVEALRVTRKAIFNNIDQLLVSRVGGAGIRVPQEEGRPGAAPAGFVLRR